MSDQPHALWLWHHDSAVCLEVVEFKPWPEVMMPWTAGRYHRDSGFYVRRRCTCHYRVIVSVRFETREEAERCLRALDDDCRRTLSRSALA